jgi:hypothetical protein
MFQIFDCNDKPVGRPQGYAKHATAERLAERPCSIKRAIWAAFHAAPTPATGIKRIYSIRWID